MAIGAAAVNSELPLPEHDSARLTIYGGLRNFSAQQVRGVLRATITRPGKPDVRVEQPVTLAAGEQREIDFDPGDSARSPSPIPTCGGPTRSAGPTSTTCSWSSASSTVHRHPPSALRHPHRHPASRQRPAIPGAGHRRELLPEGQRQGLPRPRRGVHARSAVRRRSRTRQRDAALRQGPRPEHAAAGGQDPRGTHRRDGRRTGHPADVRLDVLQPVGEMAAVGRRRQPGRQGQPAVADRDAASHASAFLWANGSDGRPPPRSCRPTTGSSRICTGRTPSSTPCRRITER